MARFPRCPKCFSPAFDIPPPPTAGRCSPVADNFLDSTSRARIKEAVQEDQAVVARLQASLQELSNTCKSLRSRLKEYERNIQRLRSAAAPWKLLPVEILARIFIFCKPAVEVKSEDEFCESFVPVPRRVNLFPWYLTHVCHAWRTLAHSTSELWTEFSIPPDHPDKLVQHFPVIESLVRYTGQRPLVLLQQFSHCPPATVECLVRFLRPLMPRVTSLSIEINVAFLPLMAPFAGQFESLQELEITIFPDQHQPPDDFVGVCDSRLALFTSGPMLRKVDLVYPSSARRIFDSNLPLPWTNLTTFSGRECNAWTILTILRNCVNLREGAFTLVSHSSVQELHSCFDSIHHKSLQDFRLDVQTEYYWEEAMDLILSKLHLPSLVQFSLPFTRSLPSVPSLARVARSAEQFLRNSGTDLQYLDIKSASILLENNSSLLRQLDSLICLHIGTSKDLAELLTRMSNTSDHAPALPQLEVLYLTAPSIEWEDVKALARVVSVRRSNRGGGRRTSGGQQLYTMASPSSFYPNSPTSPIMSSSPNTTMAFDTTGVVPLQFVQVQHSRTGLSPFLEAGLHKLEGWDDCPDTDPRRIELGAKMSEVTILTERYLTEANLAKLEDLYAEFQASHGEMYHPRYLTFDHKFIFETIKQLESTLRCSGRLTEPKVSVLWNQAIHDYLHSRGWAFARDPRDAKGHARGWAYTARQGSFLTSFLSPYSEGGSFRLYHPFAASKYPSLP